MVKRVMTPEGPANFPDNMSDAQIEAVLQDHFRIPQQTSAAGAAGRGVNAGFLSNFDDELAAIGNAVIPFAAAVDRGSGLGPGQQSMYESGKGFWDTVNANAAALRRAKAADRRQHPTASGIGQLAGALEQTYLGGKAISKLAPGAVNAMQQAVLKYPKAVGSATAAFLGAIQGGLAGAGEGDTARSRARSAGGGAVVGGVLGAGTHMLVTGLGPAIGRYWKVLRNHMPEKSALNQLTNVLKQAGYDVMSSKGAQALRTELNRFSGRGASLADVGIQPRARAGVALRTPNSFQQKGVDIVTGRAKGAPLRLAQDIKQTVSPRTDVEALDKALVDTRAAESLPLKEKALYRTVAPPAADTPAAPVLTSPVPSAEPVPPNPTSFVPLPRDHAPVVPAAPPALPTAQAVSTPGPQGPQLGRELIVPDDDALQNLVRAQFLEPEVKRAEDLLKAEWARKTALGEPTADLPSVEDLLDPMRKLDMRSLDYVKRQLDNEVQAAFARGDARAVQLKAYRDAIKDRMRAVGESSPGAGDGPYAQYLDSYRTASDMRDALAAGQKFDRSSPAEITTTLGNMTTPEKELYKSGVARNLEDTVMGTRSTGNAARNLLPSPESVLQLRATGANVDELANRVELERQLHLLPEELSGSPTEARRAAAAEADESAGGVPFNPAHLTGWAAFAARHGLNRLSKTRNAAINAEILPRLLENDPAAIDQIIAELQAQGRATQAEILRNTAKSYKRASVLGNLIGGPIALPEGGY